MKGVFEGWQSFRPVLALGLFLDCIIFWSDFFGIMEGSVTPCDRADDELGEIDDLPDARALREQEESNIAWFSCLCGRLVIFGFANILLLLEQPSAFMTSESFETVQIETLRSFFKSIFLSTFLCIDN